jgi:hypothetical protein
MAKMGRPLKNLIYDKESNLIVGLSFDKGSKTYFSSYKDSEGKFQKATFGRNKDDAIEKFKAWQDNSQVSLMKYYFYQMEVIS